MSRSNVLAISLAVLLLAASCSDDAGEDEAIDEPASTTETSSTQTSSTQTSATSPPSNTTVAAPAEAAPPSEVDGPQSDAPNTIVLPQPAAGLPDGYTEEEFFIGGEATSFAAVGEQDGDGMWSVEADQTSDYRTRMIVRRPPAERFSGTVIVEWFNVTAIEAAPDWAYVSEEIGRAGHAYVGLSAQAQGVMGGETLLSVEIDDEAAERLGAEDEGQGDSSGLVNIDPERYGSLDHPGDAYSYDILSQVGALLSTKGPDVLGGLEPTTLIAVGESQSAGFLTTYVNAIHPVAGVFDGFLIHSRGAGSAPLGGIRSDDGDALVADAVHVRTDLDEPVLILEAETDLTLLGYSAARQDDSDSVRTWEIAGTAHSDAHVFRAILGGDRDPSLGSVLGCTTPINAGPHHEAVQAGLDKLIEWAQDGRPPPTGDRIELDEVAVGETAAIARDELGVALGGIRLPIVEVPVFVYIGDPPGDLSLERTEDFSICALFGQTIELDRDTLIGLYGSADGYIDEFRAATAEAVEAGFLLPADGEQLLEEAEANRALFDEG